MPPPLQYDLTGKQFYRLQVLCRSKNKYGKESRWNCLCECGNFCVVDGQKLRSGKTKSCGCLRGQHMIKMCEEGEI